MSAKCMGVAALTTLLIGFLGLWGLAAWKARQGASRKCFEMRAQRIMEDPAGKTYTQSTRLYVTSETKNLRETLEKDVLPYAFWLPGWIVTDIQQVACERLGVRELGDWEP